jgi:hypothetical protein
MKYSFAEFSQDAYASLSLKPHKDRHFQKVLSCTIVSVLSQHCESAALSTQHKGMYIGSAQDTLVE